MNAELPLDCAKKIPERLRIPTDNVWSGCSNGRGGKSTDTTACAHRYQWVVTGDEKKEAERILRHTWDSADDWFY